MISWLIMSEESLPQSTDVMEIVTPATHCSGARLVPSDEGTHRYSGSLTTPPGTEGVNLNIFSEPITMSAKQIDAFVKADDGNSRPVLLH